MARHARIHEMEFVAAGWFPADNFLTRSEIDLPSGTRETCRHLVTVEAADRIPAESVPPLPVTLTDEKIAARVCAGEQGLFEILMRRHNLRVYRAARAIVHDDGEAEDVMQDAYVRAYEHLHDFEKRARFSTWLTRIAVNEAFARVRRGKRFDSLDSIIEEPFMSTTRASPRAADERCRDASAARESGGGASRRLPHGLRLARGRGNERRRGRGVSGHRRGDGEDAPVSRTPAPAGDARPEHRTLAALDLRVPPLAL